MLQPIETILPSLEQAVRTSTEAELVTRLDGSDLRDLVYKLVRTYMDKLADPAEHYRYLADAVIKGHRRWTSAQAEDVTVRSEILRIVLSSITEALPTMMHSIVVGYEKLRGEKPVEHSHSTLRGFRISEHPTVVHTNKRGSERMIKGKSFWIVGLPWESTSDPIAARFAKGTHDGRSNDYGEVSTTCELQLVTAAEVAESLRGDKFIGALESIHDRLRLASTKFADQAHIIERSVNVCHRALLHLKNSEDDVRPVSR